MMTSIQIVKEKLSVTKMEACAIQIWKTQSSWLFKARKFQEDVIEKSENIKHALQKTTKNPVLTKNFQ